VLKRHRGWQREDKQEEEDGRDKYRPQNRFCQQRVNALERMTWWEQCGGLENKIAQQVEVTRNAYTK